MIQVSDIGPSWPSYLNTFDNVAILGYENPCQTFVFIVRVLENVAFLMSGPTSMHHIPILIIPSKVP